MKVYGKDGRDEEFRPFAVTQYTTVEELTEMVGQKCISSLLIIDFRFLKSMIFYKWVKLLMISS